MDVAGKGLFPITPPSHGPEGRAADLRRWFCPAITAGPSRGRIPCHIVGSADSHAGHDSAFLRPGNGRARHRGTGSWLRCRSSTITLDAFTVGCTEEIPSPKRKISRHGSPVTPQWNEPVTLKIGPPPRLA